MRAGVVVAAACAAFLLDQASKWYVLLALDLRERLAIDVAPPSYAGGDAPVAPPAGPPPRPWTQVSGAGSRRRLSVGAVQFEIDDELSVAHEMSCTPRGVHIDL